MIPSPAHPTLAADGARTAVVIGGGGVYFAAYAAGYLHTLDRAGLRLEQVDLVVATSWSAVAAMGIFGGNFGRMASEWNLWAQLPPLLEKLARPALPTTTQVRALVQLGALTSADSLSIREVGRAAMASHNPSLEVLERSVRSLIGMGPWPAQGLHVVATDCYSGDRVVIGPDSGIDPAIAASASMSLPGHFGPIWLGEHLCMDGTVAPSSTHADLVGGARRVLVLSLTDGSPTAQRATSLPRDLEAELGAIGRLGSDVHLVAANPAPGTNLLDAHVVADALEAGRERATAELVTMRRFLG